MYLRSGVSFLFQRSWPIFAMSWYVQVDVGCSAQTSHQLWAMGCLIVLKAFQLPTSFFPFCYSVLILPLILHHLLLGVSLPFPLNLVYLIFLFACIKNRCLSSPGSPSLSHVPIGTAQRRNTRTLESCRQVPSSPAEPPHIRSCLAYAFCNKLARGAFADSSLLH